jgi:hypothetical protein
MRIRRAIVGSVMTLAALVTPDQTLALTCFPPPLHHQVMTAGAVFEATIASRRPLDPLLFRVLEWLRRPVMNLTDRFELSLGQVEPLRGSAPPMIRTGYSYLEPGGRYLFIARKRWIGPLVVGPCVGQVFEASQAYAVKAWVASLTQPAGGGRLFGTVYASRTDWTAGASTPMAGARVMARGPVVVETVADDRGQFEFRGLPDGQYEISAASRNRSGNVSVSHPETEWLAGDHDAAWVYLFVPPPPVRVVADRR